MLLKLRFGDLKFKDVSTAKETIDDDFKGLIGPDERHFALFAELSKASDLPLI